MKTEDIKVLIEKYYHGQTSLEEEMTLRTYFSEEKNREVDPELADLICILDRFQEIEFGSPLNIEATKEVNKTKTVQLPWYYAAAASIVFLIVGLTVGNQFQSPTENDTTLADLKDEISELKSMMNYQQLTSLSPSERIQMTYDARKLDSLDVESMNTMIDLMRFDENDNVRLSATEALVNFGKNEKIRSSFVSALKDEQNPMVKIKLIDAIVKTNQTKAIPELQKIITSDQENQTVKQSAAYGLSKLI